MPPAPEVVSALAANWSDDAYARLVERLLADPAFGDRWARNWLDVVRFAETNSYERDGIKPNAWKYRDYVVAAMNSDKPYDQFIREQIAGDELEHVTTETLTATGFYRLGIWDDEPADPVQAQFDEYDDIVTTTSQAFLALTLNCATLPRSQDRSTFARRLLQPGCLLARRDTLRHAQRSERQQSDRSYRTRISRAIQITQQSHQATGQAAQEDRADAIVKMPAPDQRATEGPEREKVLSEKLKSYLDEDQARRYDELKAKKTSAEQELAALPPREAVLGLGRCDPNHRLPTFFAVVARKNEGPAVEPAFPKLLGGQVPSIPAPAESAKSAGRRKVLADWLTSKDNWLTGRVIANRVWQHYFGRGISKSPNNFGLMGERPTHPELLDYLANHLMDHDWNLKELHRHILMSATYRQSSAPNQPAAEIDPDNQLFWRQGVRRLSAEQVRDSVLAVSGQLNEEQFGPSIFQTLSAEVLASQSVPGSGWGQSSPAEQARRSIYIRVKRSLPVPMLAAFDFPETDISCEARFLTTQPAQALGMLNSEWMQDQAKQSVRTRASRCGRRTA